jgi:hypothetical protein
MKRFAVASCLFVPALSSPASADRRLFTSTYEYKTVPQGHTALELWHTESRENFDGDVQALEHILEIEHGLTDRWDAALYTVFTQLSSEDPAVAVPFSLHEMKLETRYRFADRGEWPVDVLAYGEFAKEFGESVYEAEAKAILARDFDNFTAAVNLIGAVEFGADVMETELEGGWAAGLSYEVHPKFNAGLEQYASISEAGFAAAVGPALSIAPSSSLWASFTLGFGLTDDAPKLAGRLILGIEL